MEVFGESCGREAGGTAADNRDIRQTRQRRRQASSVRALRARRGCLRNRAAHIAADDVFVRLSLADHLRAMAAALRTYGRGVGAFDRFDSVLETSHSVV